MLILKFCIKKKTGEMRIFNCFIGIFTSFVNLQYSIKASDREFSLILLAALKK